MTFAIAREVTVKETIIVLLISAYCITYLGYSTKGARLLQENPADKIRYCLRLAEAIGDSFKPEPEEVKEKTGDRRDDYCERKWDGGPDQSFQKCRLLERLFRISHSTSLFHQVGQ